MAFERKSCKTTIASLVILLAMSTFHPVQNSASSSDGPTIILGGQISENTMWTLDDSPFIIAGNIVVDAGTALTIEPGVVVRFDGNYSVLVNGNLQAVGLPSDPIIFTSNKQEPVPGDWNSLIFNGSQHHSFTIRNSIIEYASNGIVVQSLGETIVQSSEITNNLHSGIRVEGKSNCTISENTIKLNEDGVSSGGKAVSGIRIEGNSIESNEKGINLQAWATQQAVISNITITGNIINLNRKGIYAYIWVGTSDPYTNLIHGILIAENFVSNNENGIFMYSGGSWFGSIYHLLLSSNKILSNSMGVYLYANTHNPSTSYDAVLVNNTVSTNGIGISVSGGKSREPEEGIRTNITRNLVSYNLYGIFYEGDTQNVACFNDIYSNTYGMNVSNGAIANATHNYWGASSGPYHQDFNMLGTGNPVCGDEFLLVFKPFLLSPEVNVYELSTDKIEIAVDETVVFKASRVSDVDQIVGYFFDFGDGTSSGWSAEPLATHAYPAIGSYTVSLSVVDYFDFQSDNTVTLFIIVQRRLNVSLDFTSEDLRSGENLTVKLSVSDGLQPVSEADVTLAIDNSGGSPVFPSVTGRTNEMGEFTATLAMPSVEKETVATITANATKEGYWSGHTSRQVTINSGPTALWLHIGLIIVAIALSGAFLVAFIFKRKRSKHHHLLRNGLKLHLPLVP